MHAGRQAGAPSAGLCSSTVATLSFQSSQEQEEPRCTGELKPVHFKSFILSS